MNINIPPLVSVVVPVYNRALYLPAAIDSILSQNFQDFEIIIINDGSTQDISSILEICKNKSPEKINIFGQKNKGPGGARNLGIKKSLGKYIAFLDSDDEWEQDFLRLTIEKLTLEGYAWIDTASYRIVLNDKEELVEQTIIKNEFLEDNEKLYSSLLKKDSIGICKIVDKKCFEKVGYFREDLIIREDWEMCLRLSKENLKFYRITKPLYKYNIRQNSITKKNKLPGLRCTYKVLSEYSNDAFRIDPGNRVLYAEEMWNLARNILYNKEKDPLLFCRCVIRSQMYHPSFLRIIKSLTSILRQD